MGFGPAVGSAEEDCILPCNPSCLRQEEESAEGRKAANNQDVKRWDILILVCLLLGVVTTVAVAWGFALRDNLSQATNSSSSKIMDAAGVSIGCWISEKRMAGSRLLAIRDYPVSFGANRQGNIHQIAASTIACDALPDISLLRLTADDPRWLAYANYRGLEIEARGWPVPAMWCDVSDKEMLRQWAGLKRPQILWAEGIVMPWRRHDAVGSTIRLPLRPIPVGFAIDAGLWSLVWGMLFGTLVGGRRGWDRWRRLSIGCCAKCGYSLTGNTSGACPECGATTVVKAASS